MQFGVAGYAFTRDCESKVSKEVERLTDVKQNAKGYANYQQSLQGTQLEQKMSIQEYSVSNRGLRSRLVGTPSQVQDHIGRFQEAGVDLLLLQFNPRFDETGSLSANVIPYHTTPS